MKKTNIIIIPVIVLTILSCQRDISFSDIDFAEGIMKYQIAVDGFIGNEKERYRVRLTKPVYAYEKFDEIPVVNAVVVLKHNENTYEFQYETNGLYTLLDSITGIAGETYRLEIIYEGRTYTAEETMPYEPDDEFYLKVTHDTEEGRLGTYEQLYFKPHYFGYNKTNLWGCVAEFIINDSIPDLDLSQIIDGTHIYTHKGSLPQGMTRPFVTNRIGINDFLELTDSLEIIKCEISERYEKHITDKFCETDWQGNMFSTIPGNVSTNLSEGAIGYFYAVNAKRKRFVLKDIINY